MFEDIEKYLKKRKRQMLLKKVRLYLIIAFAVLAPITVILVIHHLKKKAKKKVRQAVKARVHEKIDRKREERQSSLKEREDPAEDNL